MTQRIITPIIAAASCLLLTAKLQAGEVLVNGGFENEPQANNPAVQNGGYLFLTGTQIPGWTVVAGHGVTMHENPGPWPTISGSYSVNTDGEGNNGVNADFYQDFSTLAGSTYGFSYNWELWQLNAPNTFQQVSITDMTTHAVIYNALLNPNTVPGLVVQTVSASFLGDGDTYRLEVNENPESGFNDNQFIVDNFSVTTGVPDAGSTLGLFGLALAGFAALRRKLA